MGQQFARSQAASRRGGSPCGVLGLRLHGSMVIDVGLRGLPSVLFHLEMILRAELPSLFHSSSMTGLALLEPLCQDSTYTCL